jgi:hypothetical protein
MTYPVVFFLCGAAIVLTAIFYFGGIAESKRRA